MSAARKQPAPLRIRGTPHRLTAIVPELRAAGGAAVEVSLPAVASVQAMVLGTGELRLGLPRDTPPGVYEGMLRISDREQRVSVEVEPRARLRLFPKGLRISGRPRERVAAELTLVNEGNTTADIHTAYAFWLLHEDGADRVLGRLLEMKGKAGTGDQRLERLFDAVDEQYGGNVRVKVEDGAGELAPGASRELHVQFVLPTQLQAGQTYIGMWHLYNLHWALQVTVTGEAREEETPQ
jgi:hypothetical protein